MMENRSFDSILGGLSVSGANTDANGLTGKESNALSDGSAVKVAFTTNLVSSYDPGHSVADVTQQIYGASGNAKGKTPNMSGFAQNAKDKGANKAGITDVMSYHGAASLPVTTKLATEFAFIDDWFSSVPGPTQPNRFFLHCATAMGKTTNPIPGLSGLDCKTIYKNLEGAGKSYRVYTSSSFASTLYFKDLRGNSNVKGYKDFVSDAKAGKLPAFSYIDPDFNKNDNHPPHSLTEGENLVRDVYNAIRNSPQWNSTLFVLTYDEHGGFYDHVPPPSSVPIPDASTVSPASADFKFDRLGVRVPTILVSPWVQKGQVFRSGVAGRNFEHSSVSATLNKYYGTQPLTKRDAWALSFHGALNYVSQPRTDCPASL
ncbi:phosphoesterase [Gorgonomyces haynaldii]|nr:phosphoesterase [Gorgonomyces haynaldii]